MGRTRELSARVQCPKRGDQWTLLSVCKKCEDFDKFVSGTLGSNGDIAVHCEYEELKWYDIFWV